MINDVVIYHNQFLQTLRFFMWDQLKGFLVQVVLIPPIIAGLIFCIQWGGEYFYFYTWLFMFTVTMVRHHSYDRNVSFVYTCMASLCYGFLLPYSG